VDFFDALAVFGAIGACAEVYSIWRDRPRLVVNFGTTTSTKEPPSVWITVLNDGRQPITVRSAGFYGSEFPIEVETQEFGHGTGTATYEFPMIREPVLLDPGRLHNDAALIPDSFGYGYHVDYPLRAYAVDARGRRVWGDAQPVVRMIVGGGPCAERFPAHLWEPTRKPLCSARVEPKWKLWKLRELRTGDRGRPSATELEALTGVSASKAGPVNAPFDREPARGAADRWSGTGSSQG
jgi:hypothetical protein